jgi:hypothetical protein
LRCPLIACPASPTLSILVYAPHDDSLTLLANREFRKRAVQQFTLWQLRTSTLGFNGSRIVLISGSILTMSCAAVLAGEIWRAKASMEWAFLSVKIANA